MYLSFVAAPRLIAGMFLGLRRYHSVVSALRCKYFNATEPVLEGKGHQLYNLFISNINLINAMVLTSEQYV